MPHSSSLTKRPVFLTFQHSVAMQQRCDGDCAFSAARAKGFGLKIQPCSPMKLMDPTAAGPLPRRGAASSNGKLRTGNSAPHHPHQPVPA